MNNVNFIYELMTAKDYKNIFYESTTSVGEWKDRIKSIEKDRGTDNYIIYDSELDIPVGWIMYELENEICFLHLIAIDYGKLNKKYGYKTLGILVLKLKDAGIKRILLDVQENNFKAVDFYKRFGFVVTGSEIQYIINDRMQEYLKMEFIIKK